MTLIGVTLSTLAITMLMEIPTFDPTASTYHSGTVLSVLWSVGLLAWALRATRSNRSRFGIATIFGIMTVLAIGFVNVFAAMAIVCLAIVCLAMVFDVGV